MLARKEHPHAIKGMDGGHERDKQEARSKKLLTKICIRPIS